MLFMDVSTWESSNQDKILEHFKKLHVPEGINIINQWIDISGKPYLYSLRSRKCRSL